MEEWRVSNAAKNVRNEGEEPIKPLENNPQLFKLRL
jgi:hypothetical protein